MLHRPRDTFRVLPQYQPLMRMLGIDAEAIFTHPQIVPWRTLEDRENCILDATAEGKPIRLHIKRYSRANRVAEDEVKAFELLRAAQIPTMSLVGWGSLSDGQSFVITEHLAGYEDAEKLVQGGLAFERLLQPQRTWRRDCTRRVCTIAIFTCATFSLGRRTLATFG